MPIVSPPGVDAPPDDLYLRDEPASHLRCVIVVDTQGIGPAIGGCRLVPWSSDGDALQAALRLARAASLKACLAGLPTGGAQALIRAPAPGVDRAALFAAFGRAIAGTRGRYAAVRGAGVTAGDLHAAWCVAPFASGAAAEASFTRDPELRIATGVAIAIEEALRHRGRRLRGATVAVQGLAGAGMHLFERLHAAGAVLVAADADAARAQAAATRFGARWADIHAILREPCDVFAPCADAGVLDASAVAGLRAAIVCGAADAPLADDAAGDALHARGILHLPDLVVNAGDLIGAAHDYREPGRGGDDNAAHDIALIGLRVHELLERSAGRAPWRVAREWAREKSRAATQRSPESADVG